MSLDQSPAPQNFDDLAAAMPEDQEMFLFLPCGLHAAAYPAALHRHLPGMPVFVAGCGECHEWWVLGLAKDSQIVAPHREIRDYDAAYTLWWLFGERPQKIGDFYFKVAASPEDWYAFVRKTLH